MTVIHPLMLFLCAAGCVAGALGGQWTAAVWPFNTAVWVCLHWMEKRRNEKRMTYR